MYSYLDALALIIAAVAGSIASYRVRMDLFGIIVTGTVTAIGGGTLRDVIMNVPVFWTKDPKSMLLPVIGALLCFVYVRHWKVPTGTLRIADGLVMALFNTVGCAKALQLGFEPPVAIVMGVCTGVAGGIIRDILSGNVPFVLRVGELYATTALAGGIVQTLLWNSTPGETNIFAAIVSILVTFTLRLGAIRWAWKLPSYRPLRDMTSYDEEFVPENETPTPATADKHAAAPKDSANKS